MANYTYSDATVQVKIGAGKLYGILYRQLLAAHWLFMTALLKAQATQKSLEQLLQPQAVNT